MFFTLFFYFAAEEFFLSPDLKNWRLFFLIFSLNGLSIVRRCDSTKDSYCSLPIGSAVVILSITFSDIITFVSSAKRLSLVSVNGLPNSLKTSITLRTFVANLFCVDTIFSWCLSLHMMVGDVQFSISCKIPANSGPAIIHLLRAESFSVMPIMPSLRSDDMSFVLQSVLFQTRLLLLDIHFQAALNPLYEQTTTLHSEKDP